MSQTPNAPRDPSRPPQDSGLPNSFPPPPPPPGYAPMMYPPPQPPARNSILSRIMVSVITSVLLLSIGMNIYLGIIFAASLSGPSETTYEVGNSTKRIVILNVKGTIDDSAAAFVHEAVKALRDNPPSAVVLRVDSGGGGVSASDRIWHDLTTFHKNSKVPVVASYGSAAASGGYYISAFADYIIAEPTCMTGSIGVMAPIFTVQGLVEKIGVTPETIVATQSPRKDVANDIMRAWTEDDRKVVKGLLDHAYERFVTIVAEGRSKHLKPEEVRILADGSIYTASQAVDNKLVDGVGYLDDAIAKATELAALPKGTKPTVTLMQPRKPFRLASLLDMSTGSIASGIDADQIRTWLNDLATPRLEYTMQP